MSIFFYLKARGRQWAWQGKTKGLKGENNCYAFTT